VAHEFAGSAIHVMVSALDDPQYPRNEWWKDEKGLVMIQNELLKYIYYRIKY
jgi:hypothetical protein